MYATIANPIISLLFGEYVVLAESWYRLDNFINFNITDNIKLSSELVGVGVGRPLSRQLGVEAPEAPGPRAVHVEPPVAGEVLLLEQGPVRTKKADFSQVAQALAVICAHVESLTASLGIRIEATINLYDTANEMNI